MANDKEPTVDPRTLDGVLELAAVALLVAFLVTWTTVCVVYGVDLPFMDQWGRPVHQIDKMFRGQLGFFPDFWTQHNEARKVVPTAMSLALAAILGRYDTRAELVFGLALFAALAVAIARLARAAQMPASTAAALALLFVALAGSGRTSYFHLYSITFERLIPELGLAVSLTLFTGRGVTFQTASLGALLLVLGQYSFPGAAAGCLLVGAFVLTAFPRELPIAWRPLLLLVTVGIASTVAYFWSYRRPAHHTPLTAALAEPLSSQLRFVLRFLGNPVSGDPSSAVAWAIPTLLVFALGAGLAIHRPSTRRAALAWTTLGAYSLSQAVLATMGRLPMGLGHAMRGEYIVHATYLYVAAAALLTLLVPARSLVVAWLLVAAVSFLGLVSPGTRGELRETRAARLRAKACALSEAAAPCDPDNFWLLPSIDVVRRAAAHARRAGVW